MLNAKSQEEMDAIEHMVHKNIAKQMPEPTKMEKAVRKWNEWRYLAMLEILALISEIYLETRCLLLW